MIFRDLPQGASVFLDSNTLVYHFSLHPVLGAATRDLVHRVEHGDLFGFTSTHIVAEVVHKLMLVEARSRFAWTQCKVTTRLKQHPDAVQQLVQCFAALAQLPNLHIQVCPITAPIVESASVLSRQTGLLTNDALVVAVMQAQGLANLASNDADFDRVPGIHRYAPV